MRLSHYFLPTLRETPKDAHVVSHQLMLKSAMIYQVSAGIYAWAPLGLKVMQKIERIVREEQNAIGGLEVLMPTIQPASLWQESGRYEDYGKEMLRITDRHDVPMLYGPTGEEVMTAFFKQNIKSYKDLPQRLYQMQWKFRDEIRPRFGVMRGREFLMKDLYSFDVDEAGAHASYDAALQSYYRTFERIGVKALALKADTGPIGGDLSHEFLIMADTGESTMVFDKSLADRGALSLKELREVYAVADDQHDPANCPLPDNQLETARGIEVGHVFYFGTKYSEPLGATVTGPDGSEAPVFMGSYGIGISRLVAALIEVFHDDRGMCWPSSVAPFQVGLIGLKQAGENVANALYAALCEAGVEVLYDDKDRAAGAKFADMDLVGVPYQAILGEKAAREDKVEVKDRATGAVVLCDKSVFLQHAVEGALKKLFAGSKAA